MQGDPVKALFHPFETGAQPMPEKDARILFVNGRIAAGLNAWPKDNIVIQQYFKPWADECARAKYKTVADIPAGTFDIALLLSPRQHEEAQAAMAQTLLSLKEGGLFVAAASNDTGGKRLKKNAKAFRLTCAEESKHKSRVIYGVKNDIDEAACRKAVEAGGLRKVCGGRFFSRPGVFSWDRIDRGSALLANVLPPDSLAGTGADFGCGFGYLAVQALERNPAIAQIYCIDADARAVESCRRNIPEGMQAHFIWADIARRGSRDLPEKLDWIIMNPPFHEGARAIPEAGMAFIKTARECLRPGGQLWMVANAHLPYEKALAGFFPAAHKICEKDGYKVFHAK